MRRSLRSGAPAFAALLLFAAACTGPAEPPRAGFRWPEAWPPPARAGCAGPASKKVEELSAAIVAGRLGEVERRLAGLGAAGSEVARLAGGQSAFLRGEPALAIDRLGAPSEPECWVVTLVRAEAFAAAGRVEEAWKAIRALKGEPLERPAVAAVRASLESARVLSLSTRLREADEAGRGDEAKRLASRLVVEHPRQRDGYLASARLAEKAGDLDGALSTLRQGLAAVPGDRQILDDTVRVASAAGRWDDALEAASALAAVDPSKGAQLEEVRAQWSLSNAPAEVREAVVSERLTRRDLAVLLWWKVPEVRNVAIDDPPIATDILDRADKGYLVRALGLGLWTVDPVTHAARPEQPVGRRELSGMLSRLAGRIAPARAGKNGWVKGGGEGSTSPDRIDGGEAADALSRFRRDLFGRSE